MHDGYPEAIHTNQIVLFRAALGPLGQAESRTYGASGSNWEYISPVVLTTQPINQATDLMLSSRNIEDPMITSTHFWHA
jgi:hypothetical protein